MLMQIKCLFLVMILC